MSAGKSMVTLQLPSNSVGQIVDGLGVLIEQWDHTAEYLRNGTFDEAIGVVRECSGPEEAVRISEFYREIRNEITGQLAKQRRT